MTKCRLVSFLIAAQLLLGCIPAVPTPARTALKPLPTFEIDLSALDFMKKTFVCDTPDSEMPIADLNESSTITVEAKITVQKVEITDCDGKVTESLREVETFSPAIEINSDKELSQKLAYMSVENLRTCSAQKINAIEKDQFTKIKKQNLQKDTSVAERVSTASDTGEAQLILTDFPFKLQQTKTNVTDGNNVFKIRYFAKCLKLAEKKDDAMLGVDTCLESDLLAEKQVLVKVRISREASKLPMLKVNGCKPKPAPQENADGIQIAK